MPTPIDDLSRRQLRRDELLKILVLLLGTLFFAVWFKPEYLLFAEPVHTPARILKVTDFSVDYEFYDSLADQTLTFRHDLSPQQAEHLRTYPRLEVVYAASNSDILVVPSLKRPLPVWLFASVHLACVIALSLSIRDWWRLRRTR
ncbi:hypothetical protein E5K00_05860 [Hymenobacter aquaticus]|uniref:Uncharacterized protein n=1 Tax=Hymenobacter aquaticus TaxID=1867101 RepID=A0A4Z0Q548_9BACT|nr:hypothetical protein [Hymenobacter aquaticus]TGE24734.1 hypothetical protein E5K00_05860 [Hymenobacter aquaticus]